MAKTSLAEALRKRAEDSRVAAEALGEEDIIPVSDKRPSEMSISLDKLIPFHTADIGFRSYDEESLKSLAENIRELGLLVPIIVRPDNEKDGHYEILAGHNRVEACRKYLNSEKVRARIYYVDDDAAISIAVCTNIKQRQQLRPSERALAYRALMDVKKHQGKTMEDEAWIDPETSETRKTRDVVAAIFEVDRNIVQRYIRLSYLVKPLLQMVDDKTLSVLAGVQISYYPEDIQNWLVQELQDSPAMTVEEMRRIRKACPERDATVESFRAAWENAAQDDEAGLADDPVADNADASSSIPDGGGHDVGDFDPEPSDKEATDFDDGDERTDDPDTDDADDEAESDCDEQDDESEAVDGNSETDEVADEGLAMLAKKIVKHANAFAAHQTPDNFSKLFDAVNEAAEYQDWAESCYSREE